jgi:hypothetical protein
MESHGYESDVGGSEDGGEASDAEEKDTEAKGADARDAESADGSEQAEKPLQEQADAFAREAGLGGTHSARVFVNGKEFDLGVYKKLERLAVAASDQMIMVLQRDAYYGKLRERDNILDHLMSKEGVVKRLPSPAFMAPRHFVSFYTAGSFVLPLADTPQNQLTSALNEHLVHVAKPGTEFEVKVSRINSGRVVGASLKGPFSRPTSFSSLSLHSRL